MARAGTRKPPAEREKEIADAIGYVFGHWIRLEALAILAEGKTSVGEVARIIGVNAKRLSGHINGLYDHGCIEDMGTGTARNANKHFYRAVMIPYIDDETYRRMTPAARRDPIGLIILAIITETLAALRAGKFDDDQNARLIGDCLYLDAQGVEEVRDYVRVVYEHLIDIEVRSVNRMAESGEIGTTTIVSATCFERSRPTMPHTDYGSVRDIARGRARKSAAQRGKDVTDGVAYAFGQGVRVEALSMLADGKISVGEVARAIGVDVKLLSDHIRYLYDYGRIESAGIEKVRNTNKHFYRAVTVPYISPEDYRVLSPQERRDVTGLIAQGSIVETLAAFRSGKLEHDEEVRFIWDCLNLDLKGEQEKAECLTKTYEHLSGIRDRSAERLEKSGEQGTSMVVSFAGFQRSRPGRPDPGYGSPAEI
jgi:DNA-binding transcriptional ArsR family regulator